VSTIVYRPIGFARTPFTTMEEMPIQPAGAIGIHGLIEIAEEYVEGLADLDGFSHIILLYHFHRSPGTRLCVTPFLDDRPRGVFATRAPVRPNPLGLSVVRLIAVDGNVLNVADIDLLDATPILDIKPYVPAFDRVEVTSTGWFSSGRSEIEHRRSDGRFNDH
jgi:tRNA-Thr(GGU) m(6)t(6)A37 methyltransferase TsaA